MNSRYNPDFRYLRAYAFDPSLSLQIDTAKINRTTYALEWEKDLKPGPQGEYIEVIDYLPVYEKYVTPVDLNDPHILAENGLSPSESNPQFHQQMVYAVSMITIQNFEKALGRKILWSPRKVKGPELETYVQRLRIYPHAITEANAYYSPHRKAILFGYFSSTPANNVLHMPGSLVFTCLSHDVIAHEVTHAILDGIHPNFNNPTNPDMLAFHEAFADIVALFQHFTYPEVLKYEIANTRGDLSSQNHLGKLAQELGSAIGGYGSLRDALGEVNPETGEWEAREANPRDYKNITEPHERGSILVAAIFDAFLTIYKSRIADLLRIATNGTGILEDGEIHPDLVNRLAGEAAKSASHVLNMCIRALDYCPPVDLTFGDYLRAIITADVDLLKEDKRDYRLAFLDAFRKRGIYPKGIKTLSIGSLCHDRVKLPEKTEVNKMVQLFSQKTYFLEYDEDSRSLIELIVQFLKEYATAIHYKSDRKDIYETTRDFITGSFIGSDKFVLGLHQRINSKFMNSNVFNTMTGLAFTPFYRDLGILSGSRGDYPSFWIQNLRVVTRVGPKGQKINHVIFSIIMKSGCRVLDNNTIEHFDPLNDYEPAENEIIFTGGCTLIFDLDTEELKYAINKPVLDLDALQNDDIRIDEERVRAQFKYQQEDMALHMDESRRYYGTRVSDFTFSEPFAMLHH